MEEWGGWREGIADTANSGKTAGPLRNDQTRVPEGRRHANEPPDRLIG